VAASHPEMLTRTWQSVFDAMIPLKKGPPRERWERVGKDAAYELRSDLLGQGKNSVWNRLLARR